MTVVAIDFETANEQRTSACAVGLAWIAEGRVVRREARLVRPPELRFSPGNIRIHGILPADVRQAPTLPEALAEFLPDLHGGLLLAHNAAFDMGVLRASLAVWGAPPPAAAFLCTLQIARRVFPDPAGCGLGKVAARLGIRFAHHDAGEDAYACAEIALAALRETGAADLPALARILSLPLAPLPGRVEAPPTVASGAAVRALRTGQDNVAHAPLRFAIRGSTGNRYEVRLEERFGLYLRCSCLAGRNRRRCRHVDALVAGELTDLVSDNHGDVERLRQRLAGAEAEPVRAGRAATA